jgi:DDE superfamily endonuclease
VRGRRPVVPAAGANRRLCVYGAFNYRTGRSHYLVHPKKNAQQYRESLWQPLEAPSERRVVLVIDNASYHRTRPILTLLDDHADHAFVVWLPRYSPELNLIEGLWGYLKRSALNNYFFGDIESLEAAIHDAFGELQQHPETTLSLPYRTATNLGKTA